ncbi:hypothetical protein [Flavobacterium sp. UMI-01]|uniref:hypothetical protein n=1 Tax=Flavobacterium sp. UMI-01 TaxID=1441053 RepID=UPI001C7DE001|nr:hypothetical protein [Flavobacterium sp. UMI-01]GIZ08371.1 hypothetical protein FUMI01_10980 [Flavobacterium sp. UMI-01]
MSGGMGITQTPTKSGIPVYQGTSKDIQLLQGGCLLNTTGLTAGATIPAGTPVVYDETTRVASILHNATAHANAASNAVNYQVLKGHSLIVGDYLASGAVGGKAYAITAIDTSNSGYDVLTVGTTIGAVTAGDLLFASTAEGATASALPAINGLTYDEIIVSSNISLSVVIRGTVYARRVPWSAAIEALSGLKHFIYSKSY